MALKHDAPQGWPSEGRVTGTNVQMAYRNGPLVLKGVDFEIASEQKIGVAGRTG